MKNKLLVGISLCGVLGMTVLAGCSSSSPSGTLPECIPVSSIYRDVNYQINTERPAFIRYYVENEGEEFTYVTSDSKIIDSMTEAFNKLELAQLEAEPRDGYEQRIMFYGLLDSESGERKESYFGLEDGYFIDGKACFATINNSFDYEKVIQDITDKGVKTQYSKDIDEIMERYDFEWESTDKKLKIFLEEDGLWYLDISEKDSNGTTIYQGYITFVSNDKRTLTAVDKNGNKMEYTFDWENDNESFGMDSEQYNKIG